MAAPPSPSLRACAACGNPVDPLRAPVVAILDGRFAYFCSAECKQSTSAQSLAPPPVAPVIASVPIPSSAVPTVEEEPRRELVPEPSEALIPGPRDAAVLEPMEPTLRADVIERSLRRAGFALEPAEPSICRVDPRETHPAVQLYDDPAAALEWYTKSLRTSRRNGWQIVYDGLPLQG